VDFAPTSELTIVVVGGQGISRVDAQALWFTKTGQLPMYDASGLFRPARWLEEEYVHF